MKVNHCTPLVNQGGMIRMECSPTNKHTHTQADHRSECGQSCVRGEPMDGEPPAPLYPDPLLPVPQAGRCAPGRRSYCRPRDPQPAQNSDGQSGPRRRRRIAGPECAGRDLCTMMISGREDSPISGGRAQDRVGGDISACDFSDLSSSTDQETRNVKKQ